MFEAFEGMGGGLVNIVLGALILWVGQTTFKHNGQLAGVDEKFEGVHQQFIEVEKDCDGLRKWLEKHVNSVKDNNRYVVMRDDADKIVDQLRKLDSIVEKVERRLTDRLTDVEVKVAALQAEGENSQQLGELQMELAQLRATLAAPQAAPTVSYPAFQPAERVANGGPIYLPPVHGRQ